MKENTVSAHEEKLCAKEWTGGDSVEFKPAIAQLVEHLTVDSRSNQMVPGSIPGGRIYLST